MLSKRVPRAGKVCLLVGCSDISCGPWFYNADGRHALHWYPVLVAWIGVVISFICLRLDRHWDSRMATWIRIATAAFCCVLIVPSPTHASVEFYRKYYLATSEFADLGGDRKRYLEKNVRGYQAVEAVIKTLVSEHKQQTHVLTMEGLNPRFTFGKTQISKAWATGLGQRDTGTSIAKLTKARVACHT